MTSMYISLIENWLEDTQFRLLGVHLFSRDNIQSKQSVFVDYNEHDQKRPRERESAGLLSLRDVR